MLPTFIAGSLKFLVASLFINPPNKVPEDDDGKCELVGTFSLMTQAFLGLLCMLSLIIKRFYEYPVRRSWRVWFFDVSKQVIGAFGVHVFNLLLSIMKTQPNELTITDGCDSDECLGDPCDWYFLSIVLDCTIGVYVLYVVLSAVSRVCKEYFHISQIDSGQYGPDPRKPSSRAYFKQLAVYFGSLMITKFILYGILECFESQLLWFTSHVLLVWLNDYPNEFEIFVVMFIVPIFMNCLQLVLVDNFIQNQMLHEANVRYSQTHHHRLFRTPAEEEVEHLAADLTKSGTQHKGEDGDSRLQPNSNGETRYGATNYN